MMDIIKKIKKAGLLGRGGGCFEVAKKWELVNAAKDERKFVVCNLSEGEPGVRKDKYILDYFMSEALSGIRLAKEYLGAERAYIYMNPAYYDEYQYRLRKLIGDEDIELFKKDHKAGYIAGEETAALNHIEGEKVEPRLRPPFPTTSGLWGHPTLVNNLETFYNVFLVSEDRFDNQRFVTIGGDCLDRGVFRFPEQTSIAEILRATKNYPNFAFFVQIGGDASGPVYNSKQLDQPVSGSGTITIYSQLKHKPMDLIRHWALFFRNQSCGQCTPCREGTIRLVEILYSPAPDWEMCGDILDNLSETSFCSLGLSAPVAIRTYINNVLSEQPDNKISFPNASSFEVCDCLR